MFIQQADLFHGMDTSFVKEVMDISTKESYEAGSFIFSQGDAASHFYVMLKGRVKLSLGETTSVVHVVNHGGEAFGWSSLLGRSEYSASAQCTTETKVLRMEGEKVRQIIEEDPANGLVFFKRLAATLGTRLLQSYRVIAGASEAEISTSHGTGQIVEEAAVT